LFAVLIYRSIAFLIAETNLKVIGLDFVAVSKSFLRLKPTLIP